MAKMWAGRTDGATEQIADDFNSSIQSNESIEECFFDKETAFAIHKVLHTLSEPYKEVFSLRTFGELSFKQIAELFGKPEAWARVTYHRARLRIKEELK